MPARVWYFAFIFLFLAAVREGRCQDEVLSAGQVAEYISKNWSINRPLPVEGLEQAYDFQDEVVKQLEPKYGAPCGYKAALTTPSLQKRFNYDRPVLGTLMSSMLLRDRVILDKGFASRPILEADLMVMIRDEAINEATNLEQALSSIEGIHPIIELADLRFSEGMAINPLWITSINAGACLAVVGDPLIVQNTNHAAILEKLPLIHATVMDKQGQVLASGSSDQLMEHPLNVVLWIRDEVVSRGKRLKSGDVLWLGTLTPPLPVVAGESYQVLFTGLMEYPVSLQVNIRK
jgi:2-keto-4-pentenoate hydratase